MSLNDFATQTENYDAQEIAATLPKKVRIDGDDSSTLQDSLVRIYGTFLLYIYVYVVLFNYNYDNNLLIFLQVDIFAINEGTPYQ